MSITHNSNIVANLSPNGVSGWPGGAYLGIAWPESAWTLRTGTSAQNSALLFDFDLRNEQLAMIEELRGGGDLEFNLHFLCEVSHEDDIQRGDDDVRYYVNKSSWIACMKQFGLDRIVLLEINLPNEAESLHLPCIIPVRRRDRLPASPDHYAFALLHQKMQARRFLEHRHAAPA